MTRKIETLAKGFLNAQVAGVTLTLADWKRMSGDERVAWFAARNALAIANKELCREQAREGVSQELRDVASRINGRELQPKSKRTIREQLLG